MKYLKLFEDYYYSEEETEVCPECKCKTCECDDKSNEFDFEEDEFDYEKDGTKYGKSYLDEPPSEIHVEGKKSKPDFLDIDKDGDKKESMKKAAKDAKSKKDDKKEDKKEDKKAKGLSAAQKKLPAGLQAAIARKAAKKNPKD